MRLAKPKRRLYGKGWIPDVPDTRDFRMQAMVTTDLPPAIDLRPEMPPIYDQGRLGSCTANAICGLIQHLRLKRGEADYVPSRLFLYYNERAMEGTVSVDAGARIRDGMKSANQKGVCPETAWRYITRKFATKPTVAAYANALHHLVTLYERIDNSSLAAIKTPVAQGRSVVFGFAVYESFESDEVASTGIVPMPGASESMLGGHAVMVVGYNDTEQRFICRNSWGPAWGQEGYFTIPYAYLTNTWLCDDFWTAEVA